MFRHFCICVFYSCLAADFFKIPFVILHKQPVEYDQGVFCVCLFVCAVGQAH